MLIGGILVVVIYTLAVVPLLERAEKMGLPLNFWEPMVAVGNSGLLVLLLPSVFLVLQSDYPVIEANSLMYLVRAGKRTWLLGQILFSLVSIISYLGGVFIAVGICVYSDAYFGFEWSESTRMYALMFPNEYDSFVASLLPSNLYNQIPLGAAVFHTFILLLLYFFMLTMVMMLFFLINKQGVGLLAAYGFIMSGVLTCAVQADVMWFFPMANSIIWLHYTEILNTPVYPVWCSYLYFFCWIFILITANFMLVKKAQFECREMLH